MVLSLNFDYGHEKHIIFKCIHYHMIKYLFRQFNYFLIFFLFSLQMVSAEKTDFDKIGKNIVQIRVYSSSFDPFSPWTMSGLQGSSGTGFLIDNDRILTNAHVVSNAKYIEAQRADQTAWYELKIEFIGHDCDLAVLKAAKKDFYKGSAPLELGDIPAINSQVTVIGYPMGGNKISVSRGIISRKELSVYAHSSIDSHLVIQVDAAINPGNSGGPAFQNNKVVGVAFQVASKGQNIGYLIPTTVVRHFLKDISDGIYNGYVELGINTMNSFNESYRKKYSIPEKLEGVIVTQVHANSSAEGFLQKGDLLLEVDFLEIGKNGTVMIDKESRVDFIEIIDNKFAGETIQMKVFRSGKILNISFPAKKMQDFEFMRNQYDKPYDYLIIGGLVFQPMSRDLLTYWTSYGNTSGGSQMLYRFFYFLADDWNKQVQNDIIFYRRLVHQINSEADYYLNLTIESVNGIKIRNMDDLRKAYNDSSKKYLVFNFRDARVPLIMERNEAIAADKTIKKAYHINQ